MQAKVDEAVAALESAKEQDASMLFTGGKDSMVMLHLARERLDWTPDLLVIDTGVQFDAIYEFRDDLADDWNLEYDVKRNDQFIEEVLENPEDDRDYAWDGPKTEGCCGALKIDMIGAFIAEGHDLLLVGRRSDDVGHDLPVYDEDYREPVPHDRIHPLADWSDAHVRAYLTKHGVPLPSLYDEGYEHTDCEPCVKQGEDGDDWSGASQEAKQQLDDLRDMGYV
jgi:3'-phosphoadenosine 5'-phosphosulfate sulfotransferase (PAPS reductase)/FAD synthetase